MSSEPDRPKRRTKTAPNGDTIHEAGDCRFVASPSGTVHERAECDHSEYDYAYHPKCGQRLPSGSLWSAIDAATPAEAVLKYNLAPCGKCIEDSYRLGNYRSAIYSALAYSSADDVPDDVLRRADLEQYIEDGGATDGE
ncbi:hypothetical protein [Halopiger xanaduensis]|uniref:Uncharacterized protein n=1 Tax=Halopiger xanaduensis (strain DSM 18323 / JCM 14033 / SH-6) TaxID=797210 RepID=F8DEQ9_HALXS|nr:hypothetical protein [Halopiger xanaduensis]AEH39496.1 hypothetical protein Halxa_0256 [Halopiger xanaduensis SH-6]